MESPSEAVRSKWAVVAVCGLVSATLMALWVAVYNPILGLAPDRDSGIYLYAGQQVLKGQVLYRDLIDVKGPLLYLFNALGLSMGRGSMWGVYVLGILLLCALLVLVFLGFRHRFGFWPGTAAALYAALLLGLFSVGNQAEGYVWLMQLSGLFLLSMWSAADRRIFPYVLLGLAGSVAFFIKMSGVGLWIAWLASETLMAAKSRDWKMPARRLAYVASGAGVSAILVLAYLAVSGALGSFYRVYFALNAVYASAGHANRFNSLVEGLAFIGYLPVACFIGMWVLVVQQVVNAWRRGEGLELLALVAVVWLPLEFVIASLPGRGMRYFTACLPALILLFAVVCSQLVQPRSWRRPLGVVRTGLRATLLSALVVGAVMSLAPAVVQSARQVGGSILHLHDHLSNPTRGVYGGSCYPLVVDDIRQNTQAGDYVLVWGDYSQATNFLSERRTPTRFLYQPFLYESVFGERLVREFMHDLQTRPPVMIIDTSPSSGPFTERPSIVDVEERTWPAGQPPRFEAAWREVAEYLGHHYRLARIMPFEPKWLVYERI